ncbi:MAG: hypothetical protein ACRDWT_18250 [Jatrophihabitantaceae bacterium]
MFQPSPEIRAAAFAHEARIFESTYGVGYEDHVAEFAPYESASAFMVVLDDRDAVVGTMRLITPGPSGLKTLTEAGGEPWRIDGLRAAAAAGVDPQRTWDVATLGVAKGLGRHRFAVTASMYHGLTIAARRNRVSSLLMTVDERVRSILRVFGLPTTALPGAVPGPFCGSPSSTPVYGHCAQMLSMQRRNNPEGYRLITQGLGLDAVAIPSAEHFDLFRPAAISLVADAVPEELPAFVGESAPVAVSA